MKITILSAIVVAMATQQVLAGGPIAGCLQTHTVVAGDSCDGIAASFKLTPDQFYAMNPGLHHAGDHLCDNLDDGKPYCVCTKKPCVAEASGAGNSTSSASGSAVPSTSGTASANNSTSTAVSSSASVVVASSASPSASSLVPSGSISVGTSSSSFSGSSSAASPSKTNAASVPASSPVAAFALGAVAITALVFL